MVRGILGLTASREGWMRWVWVWWWGVVVSVRRDGSEVEDQALITQGEGEKVKVITRGTEDSHFGDGHCC